MKRIVVSLMTSGFDSRKNAITKISAKVSGGSDFFEEFILPYNREYESEAFDVSGIDSGVLMERGVSLGDGLFGLRKFIFDNCGSHGDNKPLLMGYKIIDFDVEFLREASFDVEELFRFKILDLFHVVFGLDNVGFFRKRGVILKNHQLQNVCLELGISCKKDGVFDKISAIEGLYCWLEKELG